MSNEGPYNAAAFRTGRSETVYWFVPVRTSMRDKNAVKPVKYDF